MGSKGGGHDTKTNDDDHHPLPLFPTLQLNAYQIQTVDPSSTLRTHTFSTNVCNRNDGKLAPVAGAFPTTHLPKEIYAHGVETNNHTSENNPSFRWYGNKRKQPNFSCSSLQLGGKTFSLCSKDNPFRHNDKGASQVSHKLTPDDVIKVTGEKLFLKARNTIIHQQRVFSFQVFELHRLIKVQKLMVKLTETWCNPSTHFSNSNNLLVLPNPLDSISKPKVEWDKLNISMDSKADSFIGLSNDTKLQPLYLHSPYEGPWLVPVRSPSDGLIIYKPCSVPVFPSLSLKNTTYGNHDLVSYGTPASSNTVVAGYHSNAVGQSYLQRDCPANETKTENKKTSFVGNNIIEISSGKTMSQESVLVSDYQEDPFRPTGEIESTSNPHEAEITTLSLFPTTPSAGGLRKGIINKPDVHVVKVVPHNRNVAPESAKRIFESIQEERTHQLS